jgi:hypothetical protein
MFERRPGLLYGIATAEPDRQDREETGEAGGLQ